jgi:hypothetical protein
MIVCFFLYYSICRILNFFNLVEKSLKSLEESKEETLKWKQNHEKLTNDSNVLLLKSNETTTSKDLKIQHLEAENVKILQEASNQSSDSKQRMILLQKEISTLHQKNSEIEQNNSDLEQSILKLQGGILSIIFYYYYYYLLLFTNRT